MSDDRIQPERTELPHLTNRPRQPVDRRPLGSDDSGGDAGELPKLGSLAQTARNKHLKQARTTLLVVGILMAILQTGMYFLESNQLQDEVRRAGALLDPAQLREIETFKRFLMVFHGGLVGVAITFIVLSYFVERHPVPIAVVALSLFVGLHVIFAAIEPRSLIGGWIIKIVVVVALVKALQAGLAAQKEARAAEHEAEFGA